MQTIIPIFIFILILGVVIFIHELGHFMAARRAGIFVEEFALGMGPILISRRGKKQSLDGETTLYSLRAFPVGGFCKMRGMDEASDDPEAMNNKTIPQRALVMAGGSLMNFVLAFVLFFALIMVRGMPDTGVLIADVSENMPGYAAGIRAGDVVTQVNAHPTSSQYVLIALIASSEGQPLEFLVRRDGEMINFSVTPILQDGRPLIGFTLTSQPPIRRTRIHEGIFGAGEMIAEIATGPIRLLGQFASGEGLAEGEGVVGPIGLGGMVTEAYQVTIQRGFGDMLFTMIFFTGVLNAALGVMNLLPIPALDGARLVFLGIEGVRKKPIPPDKEAFVHMIGLVSLLLLAVFIAYRDILRLIPGLNDYAG